MNASSNSLNIIEHLVADNKLAVILYNEIVLKLQLILHVPGLEQRMCGLQRQGFSHHIKTCKKLLCERICRCFDFHFEKLASLPFCMLRSETSQFYSKYHY